MARSAPGARGRCGPSLAGSHAPGLDLRADASMFPDKAGRHLAYAHEGWRGRSRCRPHRGVRLLDRLVGGPVDLRRADRHARPGAVVPAQHLVGLRRRGAPGPAQFIALACIVAVWALNVFGLRPAVWFSYAPGRAHGAAGDLHRGPYLTGDWHGSNMTWRSPAVQRVQAGHGLPVPVRVVLVRRPSVRDLRPGIHDTSGTPRWLRSAAVFTLLVFLLFPLGIGGVSGAPSTPRRREFYVPALGQIVGSGPAGVILVLAHRQPVPVDDLLTADPGSRPCTGSPGTT